MRLKPTLVGCLLLCLRIHTARTTDCYRGNGANYRGRVSVTEKGTECMEWKYSRQLSDRTCPGEDLTGHNYCRNPDNDVKPWCWVNVAPDQSGWGYCKVERCRKRTYQPTAANSPIGWNWRRGVQQYKQPKFLVGGHEERHGFAPWQGRVQKVVNCTAKKHHCGAVIISEYWLLSAAHCFEGGKMSHWRIIVGDHDKYQHDEGEQTFEVEDFIVHKDYVNEYMAERNPHLIDGDNDIALIKVKPINGKGIEFNHYVQPACLPTEATAYTTGTECIISGWGWANDNTTGNYYRPYIIRGAIVPLIADSKCKHLYGCRISKSMICAGYLHGQVDTCKGDSGGPLVTKIGSAYTVLGLTSWGDGCGEAGKPGVYTKVQQFLSWIYQHTKTQSHSCNQRLIPGRK